MSQDQTRGKILGIIGGGQLAKMMCQEAIKLGVETCVLSDKKDSPAFSVADSHILTKYNNLGKIDQFIAKIDAVTFEFENLPFETLEYIESKVTMHPKAKILQISQNRITEKEVINKMGIATARFYAPKNIDDLKQAFNDFNQKAVLKIARFGYDGKGQIMLNKKSDLHQIYSEMSSYTKELILEEKVNFDKELSIIATRDIDHNIEFFPTLENFHDSGILRKTISPAMIKDEITKQAQNIVSLIMQQLDYVGVLAVEFFLIKGKLLINEFAPRPHNSGHLTIDACNHNQFEQAVRAAIDLKALKPVLHSKAIMINLIGDEINDLRNIVNKSNHKIHDYGKKEVKQGRKMGHYTILEPLS